jgi:hypothetical protein
LLDAEMHAHVVVEVQAKIIGLRVDVQHVPASSQGACS